MNDVQMSGTDVWYRCLVQMAGTDDDMTRVIGHIECPIGQY